MQNITKHSKQRDALVSLLRSTKSHPTAAWLYENLREEFPHISLGTIYRNLKMLSDNGTILRLDIGSGTEHYDGFIHKHYHFVCSECETISDIEMNFDSLNELASKETGSEVTNHSLIFYGKCNKCK